MRSSLYQSTQLAIGADILGTHARYNRFLDYRDAAGYEARLEAFRVALGKLD